MKPFGVVTDAVVVALAAFLVAGKIDRKQHFLGELRRLADDRLDHVGRRIGKTGQVVVALDAEHVVENEKRIFDRGLVDWACLVFLTCNRSARTRKPAIVSMLQNFDVCVNVKIR